MKDFPKLINSGWWPEGHVQGIAVDEEKGYIYYSFTTILLKTDLSGAPIGSVENIVGHLGCITFDAERRRIYGSLEYKGDSIGRAITERKGTEAPTENAFYAVSFDADSISRMGMDAEKDGVMTSVYLRDVVCDYEGTDPVSGCPHIYGCSGIDGFALGPVFGESADSPKKLMICYGIYGDNSRTDNDHQVILQYAPSVFDEFAKPLSQLSLHHSGPGSAERRYFLYTGNTTWGVQNLEYDASSRSYLAAVYCGKKPNFCNPPMFIIDAGKAPKLQPLKGREESGLTLSLSSLAKEGECSFPLGQTGIYSFGDGRFCFSKPIERKTESGVAEHSAELRLYTMDTQNPMLFAEKE